MISIGTEQVCPYSEQGHDYDPWSEKCSFRAIERFDCYAFNELSVKCLKQLPRTDLDNHPISDLSKVVLS